MREQSTLVKKHFESVNDYDTSCNCVVPNNEKIHSLVYRDVLKYLNWQKPENLKVLDLGIGTATGVSSFLIDHKEAKLVGIDFSKKMLAKAHQNLSSKGLSSSSELIDEDFTGWRFPKESFDVCFSTVAIHNSTHDDKQKIFSNIFSSLKEGGIFINGDFVTSEGADAQSSWDRYYESFIRSNLSGGELSDG